VTGATAIFTGFDSAWTATNQGALAHARLTDGVLTLVPPVVAGFERFSGFERAIDLITEQGKDADLHVIGIDQPLIVPNETGCRPVERVLGSLISRLKGGMQPSNRGNKLTMFGDPAPIWPFLRDLGAEIDWRCSVGAKHGRFAIEVYPAVAFAGLFSEFLERGRLPKYNPKGRLFCQDDWRRLCDLIGQLGNELCIAGVSEWCADAAKLSPPRKCDQDKLDAVMCVIITYLWWRFGRERSMVVGDMATGYIVTPTNPNVTAEVGARANLIEVPFDAIVYGTPA
jgi:predicted RNase H-like nuclease